MTGMCLARDISREVPKQHAFAVEALLDVLERRGLLTRPRCWRRSSGSEHERRRPSSGWPWCGIGGDGFEIRQKIEANDVRTV